MVFMGAFPSHIGVAIQLSSDHSSLEVVKLKMAGALAPVELLGQKGTFHWNSPCNLNPICSIYEYIVQSHMANFVECTD